MEQRPDLVGLQFGKLTVLETFIIKKPSKGKRRFKYRRYCKCICDCPEKNKIDVSLEHLRDNHTRSCGCIFKEFLSKRVGENHPNYNPDREYIELRRTMHIRYKSLIRNMLKSLNYKKDNKSIDLVGYSSDELKNSLNITSKEDLDGKHIDHIFPVSAFIQYGITDPKIINSLDNLQLLDATENMSKGDKYNKKDFEEYLKNKGVLNAN